MENKGRIEELLSESLKRQDKMVEELKPTNQRLDQTNQRLEFAVDKLKNIDGRLYKIETKTTKIEQQLVKLNLQTAQNSRPILKLADLHGRVAKLEKPVFK